MHLTYLGHATATLDTEKAKLIIDPFLTGNPVATQTADDIEADYILLTHGHSDHIGDAEAIARRTGAPIIAMVELANYFASKGLETIGMNLGGSANLPFGRIQFTPALHSTSIEVNGTNLYFGVAAGILLEIEGKTIYHAGDTALFSDMKLINRQRGVDLALLPIGDFFTMGPEDALLAAQWVGAKQVVPIHYNTFTPIQQDGNKFVQDLSKQGISGHALEPGASLEI